MANIGISALYLGWQRTKSAGYNFGTKKYPENCKDKSCLARCSLRITINLMFGDACVLEYPSPTEWRGSYTLLPIPHSGSLRRKLTAGCKMIICVLILLMLLYSCHPPPQTMKPCEEQNTSKSSLCGFSERQGHEISTSHFIGLPPMTMTLNVVPGTPKVPTTAKLRVEEVMSSATVNDDAGGEGGDLSSSDSDT